jgi:CsoR family transcriptional regulator, copper-sensing transcriptional repressor
MKTPVSTPAQAPHGRAHGALAEPEVRAALLNRLRRAEGQLRGIQGMIERGEDCMKIAQQFAAARSALDSTYVRMTMCFLKQEIDARLPAGTADSPDMQGVLADMETLLTRRG